jgi:PAS domain S-box-containing protein
VTLVDERRRHVDVNGAYLTLLGYRREDVIGRRVVDFVARGRTSAIRSGAPPSRSRARPATSAWAPRTDTRPVAR